MERVAITGEKRSVGKGASRRARAAGQVPAVLYGQKVDPQPLVVNRKELERAVKTKAGLNVLVDLTIAGGDSGLAVIRDYQADPFRRDFIHIDFQAVSLDEKLEIEVPIRLVGTSRGVKEGGVIEQSRHALTICTTPDRIPDGIEIDITNLDIGDNLHANDVVLPEGATFPRQVNFTVVAVVPPAKEEEAAATTEEGVAAAAPAEGAVAAAAPAEEKKAEDGASEKA